MSGFTVRQAAAADKPHVTALWIACQAQLGRPMQPAELGDDMLVAVNHRGLVVGFVRYRHCTREPHSTIYEVAVHPMFRVRGVARALVNAVQGASPHQVLKLKCMASNAACLFYMREGFVQTGESVTRTGTTMRHYERSKNANVHTPS